MVSLPGYLRSRIQIAEIISGDEVAAEFFKGQLPDRGDMINLPSIAPVFDNVFLDFKLPTSLRENALFVSWDGDGWGAFVASRKVASGWQMDFFIFLQRTKDEVWPIWRWTISTSPDGAIVPQLSEGEKGISGNIIEGPANGMLKARIMNRNVETEDIADYAFLILHMSLIAISLMNCKNVMLETVEAPEKLNKNRVRKGKLPYVRYHTLNVRPIGRSVKDCRPSDNTGYIPLHICRGHFKDFRKKGLFGKHKGIFWWQPYARGSFGAGIVGKDYRIKLDKEESL